MFNVSVIIPNYNNEKYISICLDSVINQTYPISEIIVYDDCSTDGSAKILRHYCNKDKRIKVIWGETNCGVSTARDAAIRIATSDYICVLDADDFFFELSKIENEMRIVDKVYRKSKKQVIVFSQTVDVDEKGNVLGALRHVNLSGNERLRIITRLYRGYMPRDFVFPKKAYLACGGYNKAHSLYEDWELNIKLLQKVRFVYSFHYGTAYRHKPGGLSSVVLERHYAAKIEIFKEFNFRWYEKIIFYISTYLAYWIKRHKNGGT